MSTADSGPVLSGWLLSNQLVGARKNAGHTMAATARELGVHEQTIRRWESAEVILGKIQLRALCDFYGIPDSARDELEGLRESAGQPGWWNGRGPWPDATFALLGMELAAVGIRAWDMTALPGLLQTPEYARLIIRAVEPFLSPTHLDAAVDLRMGRQIKVYDGPVREMTFMIDEMALARMPGPASVRRSQITRLLTPPRRANIQVVPFAAGPHPALGSFMTFYFDSETIPAGVYVEGSLRAKGLVETGKEVERYEQAWSWLQAKALTSKETTEFLKERLESIDD
jgi:transcriptional regulator with XRE-family HTH domain